MLNAAGGSMIHKPFSKMHHLGVGTNVNNSNVNQLSLSSKGKIYSDNADKEEQKNLMPHRKTMLSRQFTTNLDSNLRRISLH